MQISIGLPMPAYPNHRGIQECMAFKQQALKYGDMPQVILLNGIRQRHDDVIKWKHFPRYWPFVRGIHRSPVNSPLKGQCHGALMLSFICAWTNGWVNQKRRWWIEMLSRSLWRHSNGNDSVEALKKIFFRVHVILIKHILVELYKVYLNI